MTLKLLDTFAGIGGFSYAAEQLVGGFKTTQFVEIEPYCQKILKKHWPNVPIHDDIKTFTASPFQFDCITGGFPCQDVSLAGQQRGITRETRSGLFYELIRVIRMVRPKYVLLENVAALLNNGMGIVLGELSEIGYDAEWKVISARERGACHLRSRVWIIAYNSTSNTQRKRLERQDRRLQDKGIRSDIARHGRSTTNTMHEGSQGFREECELPEGGKKRQIIWRSQPHLLNPNWRGYISEPTLCRGDDGLSNRVDRLKALGNSIVPAVATIPLGRILDLHKEN